MLARVCLIDGTFELFRAFYGAPSRRSPSGQEVGATISVARSLAKLLSEGQFSHFAVAFDTTVESFRNELFDGYKTGEGIDPDLFSQFPLVERVTKALGVTVFSMVEYEADDALATAAEQLQLDPEVERVVIASPDKDLCQCVIGERVVTWDRLRDRTFDEAGVVARLGVPPASVPDYLALVGDAADGIPGVPRWGAKSTSRVLSRYGRIEDIPPDPANWDVRIRGAAGLARQLREHAEDALLFRTLALLRRDCPIDAARERLVRRPADASALRVLAEEWGKPQLLDLVESST